MIKDIDNVVILNVEVYADEKDQIKDGDILVYNNLLYRWELAKNGLGISDTIFGIVCDTADGEVRRNICIEGIVEANIEEAAHPFGSFVFFKSNQNALSFEDNYKITANGFLLKYLPGRYGNVRALVKIWHNTNYTIKIPQ